MTGRANTKRCRPGQRWETKFKKLCFLSFWCPQGLQACTLSFYHGGKIMAWVRLAFASRMDNLEFIILRIRYFRSFWWFKLTPNLTALRYLFALTIYLFHKNCIKLPWFQMKSKFVEVELQLDDLRKEHAVLKASHKKLESLVEQCNFCSSSWALVKNMNIDPVVLKMAYDTLTNIKTPTDSPHSSKTHSQLNSRSPSMDS